MPINEQSLHTEFVLAFPEDMIGDVAMGLPIDRLQRRSIYLLIDQGGQYSVIRWDELEALAISLGADVRDLTIADLQPLPPPGAAVERDSLDAAAAEELRRQQPAGRLAVLMRGSLVGLLAAEPPPVVPDTPDPFEQFFRLATVPDFSMGDVPPARPPSLPDVGGVAPEVDERVINAWIDGLAPDTPLDVGRAYALCFNVDLPRADARLMAEGVDAIVSRMRADQNEIELLVLIESDDLQIDGEDQQALLVPREGPSPNIARFTVTPRRPGVAVVRALLFVNNRMFQKLTIHLPVGSAQPAAATGTSSSGLTLSSALAQPPAAEVVNLTIIKKEAGYQFILQYAGISRALLNLSETQIAQLIGDTRKELREIVFTKGPDGRSYIYQQQDTLIDPAIHQATLKRLAKLGFGLYQRLFFAPGNGPDAQAMGTLLRQLSQQRQLTIRIVSERFIFPWTLLYDRERFNPEAVDHEGFWGFKHIVEYIPEFSSATPVNFTPQVQVQGSLGLSFVCNTMIDQQAQLPIVADQRAFLQALPRTTVSEHPTCQSLYDLLDDGQAPAQLIYVYCHAVSYVPGDARSVADSQLILSDGTVTLGDLNVFAPTNLPPLPNAPLVFVNACQSAELSPYFYDGLVPYLIARGARGVIGTEVDTPMLFGAEFANRLLQRLLAGEQTLGQLLLELRREYLLQRNNVMGLLYALYSSGDLIVQWAP